MNVQTTIWVELVPDHWPEWNNRPGSIKAGKVVKRRPAPADRSRFVEVQIVVDNARFAPAYKIEMAS